MKLIGCRFWTFIAALIVLMVASFGLPIPPRAFQHPAKKICQNLISANRLKTNEECVTNGQAPEYINAMFPIGTTKEYVETGMTSFSISSTTKSGAYTNIWYRIDRNSPWSLNREFYEFIFRDGILHRTSWHD